MAKFIAYVSVGFVGCDREKEFEVPDDEGRVRPEEGMMPYPFGATPREEIVAAFREEADAVDHATEEPAWFLPFAFNETDILTLLDLLAAEVARDGDQAAWARASRVAILNRLGIQEVL